MSPVTLAAIPAAFLYQLTQIANEVFFYTETAIVSWPFQIQNCFSKKGVLYLGAHFFA
jgi:hypothetical protein